MGNSVASSSAAARPSRFTVAPTYSPLGLTTFSRACDSHAGLFGKGLGRGRRRSVLEGHLPRGAGQLLFGVGLARQHIFNQHGQTPRRRVRDDLGRGAEQPLAREQFVYALAQLGLGPGNHAGRNLFQPNFQ